MPKVGDRLIVEHSVHGGKKRIEVEVVAAHRYRFTVRAVRLTDRLPDYYRDWDVRTGTAWGYRGNYAPSIATEADRAEQDRKADAWKSLAAYGIAPWDLRGDLKKAAGDDPVRFAAILNEFIEESK